MSLESSLIVLSLFGLLVNVHLYLSIIGCNVNNHHREIEVPCIGIIPESGGRGGCNCPR